RVLRTHLAGVKRDAEVAVSPGFERTAAGRIPSTLSEVRTVGAGDLRPREGDGGRPDVVDCDRVGNRLASGHGAEVDRSRRELDAGSGAPQGSTLRAGRVVIEQTDRAFGQTDHRWLERHVDDASGL